MQWLNTGVSIAVVKEKCRCGSDRIRAVQQAAIDGRTIQHKRGRPPKVTPAMRARILELTRENNHMSAEMLAKQISEEFQVTIKRTTVTTIRHQQRFVYGAPTKIPDLTEQQIASRAQFAEDYQNHPAFKEIRERPKIYSDETRICTQPDKKHIWRQRGQYPYNTFAPTSKYPEITTMFWGAVAHGWKSELYLINKTLDAAGYEIILRLFIPQADSKFGIGEWAFMQDGASCHTTQRVTKLLCDSCHLFPSWPANSPDLNPIETVWAHLKRSINWATIQSRDHAIEVIKQAWKDLDQTWIDGLVDSFENRLRMTQAVEGRTIQPLISGHKKEVPEGYMDGAPAVNNEPYQWDDASESQLAALRSLHPTKGYKQLAAMMSRNANDVRHRMRMQDITNWNGHRWGVDPLPRDIADIIALGDGLFEPEDLDLPDDFVDALYHELENQQPEDPMDLNNLVLEEEEEEIPDGPPPQQLEGLADDPRAFWNWEVGAWDWREEGEEEDIE
jgi:transposase